MSARFGLSGSVIDKIHGVVMRHPSILRAVIYGSRAKGNFRPGSDIDLSLLGEPGHPISQHELALIFDEIDDLLLPYSLDLSAFEQLGNPELRSHIERVGQVFYERSDGVSTSATPAATGERSTSTRLR